MTDDSDLDRIRRALLATSPDDGDYWARATASLERLRAKVTAAEVASVGKPKTTTSRVHVRGRGWPWRAFALSTGAAFAVVALVVSMSLLTAPPSENPSSVLRYATHAGQRATVRMAHGETMVLGPMTQVAVTSTDGHPVVAVNGEVLFTIPRTSNGDAHPFTVQIGHTVARVLGTTFLARGDATDSTVRIVVADGKVAVHAIGAAHAARAGRTHDVVLAAGMMSVVRDSGDVEVLPHVALDDVTALRTGALVFHNAPLRDVARELSRAYDVDVTIGDSVLAQHLMTTKVSVTEHSLQGVLDPLLETLDAHAVRTGRSITIVPGRRAPEKSRSHDTSEVGYGR